MSKLTSRLVGTSSAALAAALLVAPNVANATGVKIWSYAVKSVCEEDDQEELDTKVNIHNPSLTASASYIIKIVWPDQGFTLLSKGTLDADTATRIECGDFVDGEFEGFVVVLSRKLLDVAGTNEIEHAGDPEHTIDLDVTVYQPTTQIVDPAVWTNLWNSVPNP